MRANPAIRPALRLPGLIGLSATAVWLALAIVQASAQETGLRGTRSAGPDAASPYDALRRYATELESDPASRTGTYRYQTDTVSSADLESQRYDGIYGAEPDTDSGEASGANTTGTARRRSVTLPAIASAPAAAELPDALATGAVRLGPNGQPLPAGAIVTDTGEILTGSAADRYRYGRERADLRAQPQNNRDITPEADPFKAPGIRAGSLILRPTLEQGIEYSTNSNSVAGGGSGALSVTTLGITGESEWKRGALGFSASGTWREALSGPKVDTPDLAASLTLSQPVGAAWEWTGALRFQTQREAGIDPLDPAATGLGRSLETTFGGTLGLARNDGLLRPSFEVDLSRATYGAVSDGSGGSISQADRDATRLRGTARLGYAVSPAFIPFIQLDVTRLMPDQAVDSGGIKRANTELRASLGTDINLSEKLTGRVSAGYFRLFNDDPSLGQTDGFAAAASLAWSPLRGTTLTTGYETTVGAGAALGETARVSHTLNAGFEHALSERFRLSGAAGANWLTVEGTGRHDRTLSAELAGTWYFSRYLAVTGRARHEQVTSSLPGQGSETTTLSLGLRLQR